MRQAIVILNSIIYIMFKVIGLEYYAWFGYIDVLKRLPARSIILLN